MSTGQDVINGALRALGVIASGENASGNESVDALSALNGMLDSWSNEGLAVNARVREEFTLVAGTAAYTIGSSGDFNTTRPMKIEQAMIEDQTATPTAEYPVRFLNLEEWANIAQKDTDADIPTDLYIEDTYPLATLRLYPVPATAHKLVIYSWKPLTQVTSLGTTLAFPPGYFDALKFNLAIRLAPEFNREPSPTVVDLAKDTKMLIKRMNSKRRVLKCDSGVLGDAPFNILTGDYR